MPMVKNGMKTQSYWNQPVDALFIRLKSRPKGLSAEEAEQRLREFGPNTLTTKRKSSPLRQFLGQFKSPLILILIFAALVSIIFGELVDATIVIAIIFGSAALTFVQEYRANRAVEKLREKLVLKANVFREGKQETIPAEKVVPGDVVVLSAGSLIPADGVVLEARDFFVNQAALTGETFPVEKKPGVSEVRASLAERTNCVFMGTSVRSGFANLLVVETGAATAYGQIASRLNLRPPETEFEHGIHHFGLVMMEIMTVLVLVVFAINVFMKEPLIDSFLFSVALAVGLAPELLPAVISLNLSKGAQVMAKAGVIVRRLSSIQNIGSMDVLCTDKTGTITEGVVELDEALDIDGKPSDTVLRLAYLNSRLQTGLQNLLDEAVIAQGDKRLPGSFAEEGFCKIDEIPFDFVRRRLSIVVREKKGEHSRLTARGAQLSLSHGLTDGHAEQTNLMITKGALERILDVCTQVERGGEVMSLDEDCYSYILQRYTDLSEQGFRVLGVATKEVSPEPAYSRADETNLTFNGFLTFFDPPKKDALKTITQLGELGVQFKIVTGDNRLVAQHIAELVGMKVSGVLTGRQMGEMSDEALWQSAERVNLFAEVDPNDKERIIHALHRTGHVVGFLGDGINDAPALYAADIGISVDTAVDVAKEAADLVLLERDLEVLRRGIILGRVTFANSLKYIFTTTSANFGNMFSMAGTSLFLPFLPLLPKQILLNNFLSDIPALAIATDEVDPEMIAKPRHWDIHFIRDFMLLFGIVSSVFDYLTFGLLLLILHASPAQFRTGWFIESLMTELCVAMVVRTRRPFFRSKPGRALLISTVIVAILALAVPYLPFLKILGFAPLPLGIMAMIVGITLLYMLAVELTKKVFYAHVDHPKHPRYQPRR